MTGWIVLALWMSGNFNAVRPPTFNHVRSAEPRVSSLITEGYARSGTFKALVDRIEERPCIVYVSTVVKLSQGMRGALLHSPAGLPELPVLRVVVSVNLSRDEAIGTIGHELQHVLEAAGGVPLANGASITVVFDRLDPRARSRGIRKYETDAAVLVTRKVRDELCRFPRVTGL